jgi:hypothetical protein
MFDTHIDEATLTPAGKKATIGGDCPRDLAKEFLVMLDRGHQQERVGAGFVDSNVGDDTALSLLHLDDDPKLRRSIEFPLRMICAHGSKMLTIFPGVRVWAPSTRARVWRMT